MTDERERELFDRRHEPAARAELVERYDGLARRLAYRFRGRGESSDDLAQVARLGLLNAIDRFDPERGVRFATYATRTILGELKRHLRDKTWAVRVPRSVKTRWLDVRRAIEELTHDLGRSPTVAEVAAAIDATSEEVLEAMDAGDAYSPDSLDRPVGDEDGAAVLGDFVPDPAWDDEARSDERVEVSAHIEALPDRLRAILFMRFFEGKTQSEIGDQIGISQMHVSRLLRQALSEVRAAVDVDA